MAYRTYEVTRPDGIKAKYPSVTTILKSLPKSPGLIKWMDETPNAGQHTRNRATIGTIIHWRINRFLSKKHGLPPQPLSLDCTIVTDKMKEIIDVIWSYFLDAEKNITFKPLYLEQQIVNHEYQYAGTADYIGLINGKRAVGDFKTFKRIYDDHTYGAQLAAYKRGIDYPSEELYIIIINEEVGYELVPISDDWDLFKKALKLNQDQENKK
jgi:hypothetical protein